MIRLQGMHRRNAARWMADTCTVHRWQPDTSDWMDQVVVCTAQQPRGPISNADPDEASSEERADLILYCDPGSDVDPGDHVTWRGERFMVATSAWRRSDQPYRKITCTVAQSAVMVENLTFYRITYDQDGIMEGQVTVGSWPCRVLIGIAMERIADDRGAAGQYQDSRVLAPVDATDIRVGDWFVRGGLPGHITGVDRSAPDHIELSYRGEKVVP